MNNMVVDAYVKVARGRQGGAAPAGAGATWDRCLRGSGLHTFARHVHALVADVADVAVGHAPFRTVPVLRTRNCVDVPMLRVSLAARGGRSGAAA